MTRNLSVLPKVSTLALAIAMAAGPSAAVAQSFQGTHSATGATVDQSTPGQTNVNVTQQQAVINWTATNNPSGGQIVFQPDGTVATFSGASDFAVLNRVMPGAAGNAIYMGGAINSLVNGVTGGTVFFYSPNGIIIGQNAVINVGSLGLTTSNISDDGQGNWMTGFGTANPNVTFEGAIPGSFVRIDNSAQLSANGSGNYVAVVAPVINHSGTIRTDGGAALVAAEAASITFSDSGLYNIEVTTGSEALQALTVNGGQIGRNSEVIGGDHHAYLVAVPKNDVTTLLITGGAELGFDIAGSAGVEGNTVVLNSGYLTADEFALGYLDTTTGNLTIDHANFTSNVETIAHGDTQVSTYTGPTSFSGNLDINNDFTAFVGATTDDLTIAGDLDIHTWYIYSVFEQPQVSLWAGAGATLSTGNVDIRANTHGANSIDEFSPGESVTGGEINVTANDGGHIVVNGSLYGEANGSGGAQDYFGGVGGDGTGGTINVSALGAGSSINAGITEFNAQGMGGSTSECLSCNISGGVGRGGTITVQLDQGAAAMTFGALDTWASGQGGYGAGGNGGDGLGGTSNLSIGGGSTLTVNGTLTLDASGTGGSTGISAGGVAGDGTGGNAQIHASGGLVDIAGNAFVNAIGWGGDAVGGTGGNATGGSAFVGAPGGAIHVVGNLNLDGSAIGGAGATGGNAVAKISDPQDELQPIAAALYVQNNGTIQVDGATTLRAEGVGGNATSGNGGNAQGGEIDVVGYFGDITLGTTTIDVDGRGGAGGLGGSGGNGLGGNVDATFGFEEAALGGIITFGSAIITADGKGGAGGVGAGGNTGGNGGIGGDGTGGAITMAGSAAGGTLISGTAFLTALGTGGGGGAGGNGDSGTGGNGGAGGNSQGGFIQTGTLSSNLAPGTGGGATYTNLSINTNAAGGVGGNGGTGGGGTGVGGNGGNAVGGQSNFLVRGVLVTADSVSLAANGTGGNGGTGSVQGDGGDATTGYIAVESKDRFDHPSQRGNLQADFITGSAIATGGSGATNGTSTVSDGSYFRVLNGDATIGSVAVTLSGQQYDTEFGPSLVSMRDGNAVIDDFSFVTPGELALDASNGWMTAGTITLSAGTFVVDDFNPPQVGPGTYFADVFDITTGGDFITNAHLNSTGSLEIIAPGLIDMRSAFAATNVDLDAVGNIGFGDIVADDFDFSAGGDVTGGNIVAGTEAGGEAEGAIVLGNVSVGIEMEGGASEDGFAVGFVSATSINVQDVEADEAIGFATLGNLTTGDLDAGTNVMALVGGDMSFGSITTAPDGRTYLADAQMFLDAGGPDEFDPSLVFNADPLATGGSISIGGPVTTGLFQAAAGDDFSALGISASSDIAVSAGGTAAIDGAWSAEYVQLVSNDIDITINGSIGAGEIDLLSSNATQTVVGDGVSGGGYQLSDAEYDRLDSSDIDVIADAALGAATRILIGDLSANGSGGEGGSEFEFVTFDSESENVVGSIRVVGDAMFSGMGAGDGVAFTTNRFELDAATGLLSLENAPGTLGGVLFLDAAHIHVASGDILDQLAEDPQYDGYQDDLNAPAAQQRPDGVLRADSIEIEFYDGGETELNTLYVQNTGSAETPAGFLVGEAVLFGEGSEVTPPPGSIDVVINGQIVTEGGTLTGVEVRDALVEAEEDLTPFTANSTVNGCLLTGACGVIQPPEPPFPPGFNPAGPGIQDEVTLIDDDILPPPDFGNEDVIDDNDEETEDDSPIEPPSPLFDTSELSDAGGTVATDVGTPMRSAPGLTDTGDIDDPVSGSGNPALMETSTPPPTKEEEQQQ